MLDKGNIVERRNIKFISLQDESDSINAMSHIATEIVREHFDPIIGKEQNDYMIAKFQTPDAIQEQMRQGVKYYFVVNDKGIEGFLAFYPKWKDNEIKIMYLSKFYLYKVERGKGIACEMLKFVCTNAFQEACTAIELNVNKNNDACKIYESLGFVRNGVKKTDIGNGFYMDDYVYRMNLCTGSKAKSVDQYAIQKLGIPSLELMETASACVSKYLMKRYASSKLKTFRFLSVCGVGNNGADGVCVARQLMEQGYDVGVLIVGSLEKATEEFRYQLEQYRKHGGKERCYSGENINSEKITFNEKIVLIDGLFGIGLKREIQGVYKECIEFLNALEREYTIAIDVPSGINADTGELMGTGIHADTTITFGCMKAGLVQKDGPDYAGKIVVRDIGIPMEAYDHCHS